MCCRNNNRTFAGGLILKNELDYTKLGERLKEARIKKHMTQEELSEKIDSATSSISHLENGTHSPSLKTLNKDLQCFRNRD